MTKLTQDQFSTYLEAESAIAPIDDVIDLLNNAHEDFNLGDLTLDQYQKFDLLNRYQTLGSILRIATRELSRVVEDFEKIGDKVREAQKAGA